MGAMTKLRWAIAVGLLLVLGGGCKIPIPGPQPTPTPPPAACLPKEAPWCGPLAAAECWQTRSAGANLCEYVCRDGDTPAVSEPMTCPDTRAVCKPDETCGCYHRPPGQPWIRLPDCQAPPGPEPPPPAQECVSNPDTWKAITGPGGQTRIAEVNQAEALVKATHADWFNGDLLKIPQGGRCDDVAPRYFQSLALALRALGTCAWPAKDAIHPASKTPGRAEQYHLVNFGGCRVRPASKENAENDWDMGGVVGPPPPTPAPTPPPTPGPTPTPVPGASCPVPPSALDPAEPFRADVKPHPPAQTLDLTLFGGRQGVKAVLDPENKGVHGCLNAYCPFEEDKGTGPCADELWGKAQWSVADGNVDLIGTSNSNTIKVRSGKGTIKVCGSAAPSDPRGCWLIAVDAARMAEGKPLCFPDAADATKCQKDRR